MKVSVITPTYDWHRFLPYSYLWFSRQTYQDREWVILDDSPEPCRFFLDLDDKRVRYFHDPERRSVGDKRNRLIEMARGEVIAQFDHDDYYSPEYLAYMVGALEPFDIVKLRSWFGYAVKSGWLFYWETHSRMGVHYKVSPDGEVTRVDVTRMKNPHEWNRRNVLGYGFSYVFRKSLLERGAFPDTLRHDEDLQFMEGLMRQTPRPRIGFVDDQRGLMLHLTHPRAASIIVPNYRLPSFFLGRLFEAGLRKYLDELAENL